MHTTKKLFIDNLGWNEHRAEQMKLRLAFLVGKIDELIGLKNPIVVNLQNSKNDKDDVHSQYYEGVINIYENTPDWRGDFLHELAHQFFKDQDLSSGIKVKLAKIRRRLKREHGDGRVFIIEHTYKDDSEVLCTLFKWYMLGKIIDDTYLIILKNYCMEGYLVIDKAINGGEKMEKSEKKAVVVDIDKTIFKYKNYKKNKWGNPIKDSVHSLIEIKYKGYKIILHTSRGNDEKKKLKEHLKLHDIPYDELVMNKPMGDYYVDDKGIEFKNWKDTEKKIKKSRRIVFNLAKARALPVGTERVFRGKHYQKTKSGKWRIVSKKIKRVTKPQRVPKKLPKKSPFEKPKKNDNGKTFEEHIKEKRKKKDNLQKAKVMPIGTIIKKKAGGKRIKTASGWKPYKEKERAKKVGVEKKEVKATMPVKELKNKLQNDILSMLEKLKKYPKIGNRLRNIYNKVRKYNIKIYNKPDMLKKNFERILGQKESNAPSFEDIRKIGYVDVLSYAFEVERAKKKLIDVSKKDFQKIPVIKKIIDKISYHMNIDADKVDLMVFRIGDGKFQNSTKYMGFAPEVATSIATGEVKIEPRKPDVGGFWDELEFGERGVKLLSQKGIYMATNPMRATHYGYETKEDPKRIFSGEKGSMLVLDAKNLTQIKRPKGSKVETFVKDKEYIARKSGDVKPKYLVFFQVSGASSKSKKFIYINRI